MPDICAFSAICSSTRGDLSSRIAPPYDVLDEGPKQALLDQDAHNIVAIDLPVTPPKTVGPDEAYVQAGQLLKMWLNEGVLKQLSGSVLFAYEQEYDLQGRTMKRRGIFAGVKLEEFNQPNGVFRHEMTIQGGIDDRYKLMEATGAQMSPVFSIFNDPQAEVAAMLNDVFEGDSTYFGKTDDGVMHRCWVIEDEAMIKSLQKFFTSREVFIADGHHRYTTALKFHEDHPDLEGATHCMMVLVAAEDPGMVVLPTHRVICGLQGFSMAKLREVIADMDTVELMEGGSHEDLAAMEASLPAANPNAMALIDFQGDESVLFRGANDDPLLSFLPDKPEVWRKLDVAVLHELLIDRILRPHFGGDTITFKYTADLDAMKQLAGQEPGRLAVVMQSTPLQSVCDVSRANEVMPPKSTFFYPKLATGFVINDLGSKK